MSFKSLFRIKSGDRYFINVNGDGNHHPFFLHGSTDNEAFVVRRFDGTYYLVNNGFESECAWDDKFMREIRRRSRTDYRTIRIPRKRMLKMLKGQMS